MRGKKLLSEIGRKYQLDERAKIYLDSIAWQLYGLEGEYIKEELETIAKISINYEAPYEALKLIDSYLQEYLRNRTRQRKVGSFEKLLEIEEKIKRKLRKLTLSGLEGRIESILLGIETSRPNYYAKKPSIREDDVSPLQQNAIRNLEGD